jgi:hypothetical protein
MAEAGAIVSTTLLEVLIFSGDKEKREHDGRKHIGAADLLREMARRKAANPAWNDKDAIGHCVRSFRNGVAVWWEEAIPSDNSPKMLRVITTSWKEFEILFRRAWKIKATMTSVSWMENAKSQMRASQPLSPVSRTQLQQLAGKHSLTRQTTSKKKTNRSITTTPKYLAAQAVYDARAVATP